MDTPIAESPVPSPAPAQSETVVAPATAVDQAIQADDVASFRAARSAERAGKPLALAPTEPPTPAEPAIVAEPERQISKRQQETNDRIREAVTRATAEKDIEIARLKAAPTPPAEKPSEPTAPTATRPEPSEGEIGAKYATYSEYVKDVIRWEREQADAAARHERETADRTRTFSERQRVFAERIAKARTDDAERFAKLEPSFSQWPNPVSLLAPGAPVSIANHISEAILTADDPLALVEHVSDPAEAARLQSLHSVPEFYREIGRIEGRRQAPPPPTIKPVTSAPPPPTTLGRQSAEPVDAKDAAVAAGDMAAYKVAKLADRAAMRR